MKRVEKPWGHEMIWAVTDRYVGKVLHIKAGHKLSLQYHRTEGRDGDGLGGADAVRVLRRRAGRRRSRRWAGRGVPRHPRPASPHDRLEDTDVFEVSTTELDDVVRLEDAYGRKGTSAP